MDIFTLIPAFVAFPLVGSLVNAGASIVPAVAFLTTLTMVGIVTFPLEKKQFGKKFALTATCGVCAKMMPGLHEMKDNKAMVQFEPGTGVPTEKIRQTVHKCPTKAIVYSPKSH